MREARQLYLRLIIKEADLSVDDFIGLFECAEIVSRHIAEQEALNLFEFLKIPSSWRIETLQRIRQLGRRIPSPAEVKTVERGSWSIEVIIASPVLLFILKNYLHPIVKEAWDDSRLREKIINFIRDEIFLGSKRQIEEQAIKKPRYRNLKITRVGDLEKTPDNDFEIEISFEKQEILEARASARELIKEFVARLQSQ